jgi:hypothetical protein
MRDLDNQLAGAEGFSELEEEFFRAGDAVSAAAPDETWPELEAPPPPTGLWARVFKRSPRRAPELAAPPARPRMRPASEPAVADDEWDWQIAIARARHVTSPGM